MSMSIPLYQAKAEFFKTLGHPARIRILELLSEREKIQNGNARRVYPRLARRTS